MKCEYCDKEHDGSYGSGRFCSCKCARGFSSRDKRKEINEKVSKALTKRTIKYCKECRESFLPKKKKNIFCSVRCSLKYRWKDPKYKKYISDINKKRCESLKERSRMREIGRKGGFGKKGYTKIGVRYESNFEKQCFEHLDLCKIKYIPHRGIPNSSKVSDIYLDNYDIWIELDGIDREKRKKWLNKHYTYWLNKLEIYKKNNFKIKIIKKFDEFKDYIARLV